MTFPILFTAYVALVVLAAVGVAARWLGGRARLATIAGLVIWLGYAAFLGATGVVAQTDHLPPGLALLTVPVVLTLLALTLSAPGAALSHAIPLRLLLGSAGATPMDFVEIMLERHARFAETALDPTLKIMPTTGTIGCLHHAPD